MRDLVSIIIATFNAANTLEKCIQSVIAQDYPYKELIIIDGASTDNSVEIIKKYQPFISYWVSEPDSGIYDAWNKALKQTKGEWICFIGADDYYLSKTALSDMLALAGPETELISAKINLISDTGKLIKVMGNPWKWSVMKRWMCVSHPGLLHKRALFAEYGLFSK